jgi:hypothetical protein
MSNHQQKIVKIDYHTFGGTEASEILASILNTKYPRCVRRVSSYYHKYTRDLIAMVYSWKYFVNEGGLLLEFMELHKQKKFAIVEKSNLPAEVKSFLLNVMSVSYYSKRKVVKNLLKNHSK